jgi:hypothetical protein
MAIEIGNLVIELSANVARLSRDMEAAKRVTTHRMGEINEAVRSDSDFSFSSGEVGRQQNLAQLGASESKPW